ncbi:hypothetical protein Bp8pC_079 [Bacillus phage Bp8p-C]|uniref:Uncharacterized protein n=2 Tax=Agatevirus Bp8pC TaxID=1910937 RepID=A0A0A0PLB1_9CAUD|nr:hypothetical protein AXJ20_gp079 [Bacillus phage Bp8p-C]YP_009784380.1 hypothetical protein QLX39_gp079 [Bacillus phage Bp8p-T]AHJ87510.1 hypothetical protein Bp8pC_079 [Bacillus phage Bp8p-C]AHJ87721.1 hypothetical protein Bp8pT_079 [Bacillus phage Bp8p-T]
MNQEDWDFEEWLHEVGYEMFRTEEFKAIGKENDYVFQALAFMGEASKNLSLATTVLSEEDSISADDKARIKAIQRYISSVQEKIRSQSNNDQ